MPKPKFIKPLLIGVACTIPVGLVVGLSVNWDHTQFISAVGSSGVKPFIENFGKMYHEAYSNYDVTVESGGTTFAIEQVAKGFTNLGNASNNPYFIIKDQGYSNEWKNKKTLTLGWEGLCLMYSLPDGLSKDAQEHFNIVITKDNILKLYGVFSCFHELENEKWKEEYETLWYYAPSIVQETIKNPNDVKLLKQTKILPFVRSGGNTSANSSIAFTYYSNLADFDDMTDNQQKAFAGGQYGDDSAFVETDESNARAWQSFTTTDRPGSMVYLTTSFLTNADNREQIKELGYKLAGYQSTDGDLPVYLQEVKDLNKICVAHGYNWYRPINVMVDLDVQKSKDFIYWIYMNTLDKVDVLEFELSKQYKETVAKLGAKPLTHDQFKSMLATSNGSLYDALFDKNGTDFKLEEMRQDSDFATVYGASDIWEE